MKPEFDEAVLKRRLQPMVLTREEQAALDQARARMASVLADGGRRVGGRRIGVAAMVGAAAVLIAFTLINWKLIGDRHLPSPAPPSPAAATPAMTLPTPSPTPTCPVDYFTSAPSSWTTKCDFAYGIQFSYPTGFRMANSREPYALSLQQSLGADGRPRPVADVCRYTVAGHKLRPYGTNPAVLPVTVHGQEGCFVFPSSDSPPDGMAEVVFKLPTAVGDYTFGWIIFDARAITGVAATVRFFGPGFRSDRATYSPPPNTDKPPSAAVRCRTGALTAEIVYSVSVMNQPRTEFELTNTGNQPCQTYGWPGIQLLDAAGRVLPASVDRAVGIYVSSGSEQPTLVTLAPAGHAYFGIGTGGADPCVNPARILITPPDEIDALRISATSTRGALANVCREISVLPVQAISRFTRP